MYNRYISDQAHVMVDPPHQQAHSQPDPPQRKGNGLLSGLLGRLGSGIGTGEGGQLSQTLSGVLKSLHLEHLDTGDILLGLIVLFLVLEDGDDLDLLITLALTILLSLGEP